MHAVVIHDRSVPLVLVVGMNFQLFQFPVQIHFTFWINAFFLSFSLLRREDTPRAAIAIWLVLVLITVLLHELGHAFAARRRGLSPQIHLHAFGGATNWQSATPLSKKQLIQITLAGPLVGATTSLLIFALSMAISKLPVASTALWFLKLTADEWFKISLGWTLVNLLPLLPLDGGHLLLYVLGPERSRITATISFVTGIAATVFFIFQKNIPLALIFGFIALQSFIRFEVRVMRGSKEGDENGAPEQFDGATFGDPELNDKLQQAHQALLNEEYEKAITLANEAADFAFRTQAIPPQMLDALELLAWAYLRNGNLEQAASTVERASQIGEVDPALLGAIRLYQGNPSEAKTLLEKAQAAGQRRRKEVFGPLIQALIQLGHFETAAETAFDVRDQLSEEDLRKIASIAEEHGASAVAARLYESVFFQSKTTEDAYRAARCRAQNFNDDMAFQWLEKAIAIGFQDLDRLLNDHGFESIRNSARFDELKRKLTDKKPLHA